MKRENYIRIDELMGRFVREFGLEEGLQRSKVLSAWDQVVGLKFSKLTTNKYFKDNKLRCTISSSVARDQLFVRRLQIKNQINELIGKECVSDIILS